MHRHIQEAEAITVAVMEDAIKRNGSVISV
jgi:hypothetical protein